MNIEITERQAPHVWVVHLDGWVVSFRSVKTAQDFVDVLQARINAPHMWPNAYAQTPTRPVAVRRMGASVE